MGRQLDKLDIGILNRERQHYLELTQEKLAVKLDVPFPSANLWENNREMPSPLVMDKMKGMLRSLLNAPSVTLPHVTNRLVAQYFPEKEHRL